MKKKETIVYTSGTWDLFHIGHLNILEKSAALGDKLIVGVSTDELIYNYKGIKPVIPFEQRLRIVEAIGVVTSGTMSPTRKIGIGMGYVKPEYSKIGTEICIDMRGRKLKAVVVRPPFRK